jgi:predicted enzyme related to lactoylglutathione lyase
MRSRHLSRVIRCGFAAVLFGIAGAAFAFPEVPPVSSPPSGEHHVGKVVFLELVTPDLAASKRFYGSLFGWTFTDSHAGDVRYAEASLEGYPVAGMIHRDLPAGQQRQPSWLNYIAVRNVDETREIAISRGATVLYGPRDIPHRGREAVLADPQGAVFAILASSSGDPPDAMASPGEWIWSSLMTTDPDSDAAFYQTLFDYEVFDLPSNPGRQHLMFASDNYLRASANSLPADVPGVHPHWVNYVRVNNAGVMAQKVVELGGRVLLGPRLDRHGGMLAIVADPQGAIFGLIGWPDSESKEVTK